MKTSIQLLALVLFTSICHVSFSQTSGGPDAYGYTWKNSFDASGPAFNWIDITSTGTLVSGLTDDNSVAFVSMGMSFHYYWGDYNQIKIGSNGWLGFDNVSNIAHCFPAVPTPGGATDTYLAPFMSDLIFNAAGTNGEVWYEYDSPNNRFIVSYINTPWWASAAPGYAGLNSFQVIMDAQDSSITYQYLLADQMNFNNSGNCATDMVIGIENQTGDIGLAVYTDTLPQANEAIKFYYPANILLQVKDVAPNWIQNNMNQGTFYTASAPVNFQAEIGCVGNADVNSSIMITMEINDISGNLFYSQTDTLLSGMVAGASYSINYNVGILAANQYNASITVSSTDDVNAANNTIETDLEVIDMSTGSFAMSYNTHTFPSNLLLWSGGGGGAIHIVPPSYPVTLDSVEMWIGTSVGPGDYYVQVLDDDGVNGGPGTLLSADTVLSGTYTIDDWVSTTLSNPVTVSSGGIFIAWIDPVGSTMGLGMEATPPFSRRSYEFIGGNWAPYRESTNSEPMIDGWFSGICGSFSTSITNVNGTTCEGGSDGSIDITTSGGFPPYSYSWSNGLGTSEDQSGLVGGAYAVSATDSAGCTSTISVTVSQPAPFGFNTSIMEETIGNDGSISLTVTGGNSPYTYLWNTGETTQNISNLAGGSYSVTATDAMGCTGSGSFTVGTVVNVQSIIAEDFISISPNPAKDQLNITISGTLENAGYVEIFDMSGRQVFIGNLGHSNTLNIDISWLKSGPYLIRTVTSQKVFTKRFTKM